MKKILILSLIISIISQVQGLAQWEKLTNGISFKNAAIWYLDIDEDDGSDILMSSYDHLYYTTTNGDYWQKIVHPESEEFQNVRAIAVNKNIFVIQVESNPFLYISKDYGKNWIKSDSLYWQFEPGGSRVYAHTFNTIEFINDELFVGTDGGLFILSKNGKSWISPPFYTNYDIKFPPNVRSILKKDSMIFVGETGGIYVSKDSGNNWEKLEIDTNTKHPGIESILSIDDLLFAFAGRINQNLYMSKDNGINWSIVNNDIDFHNVPMRKCNKRIFIRDFGKGIFYSDDSGKTFIPIPNGYNKEWAGYFIMNDDYFFVGTGAAGEPSGLYRAPISNCEIKVTDVKHKNINKGTKLFPNPATDRLYLDLNTESWHLSTGGMEIYNTFGEKMSNVSANILGEKIAVDVSGLNPGMYFLSYSTMDGKFVEKFIVIK